MTRGRILDVLTAAVLLTLLLGTALSFASLPERIPTHFDAAGVPNAWAPKAIGAWLNPGFALALALVLRAGIVFVGGERRERVQGVLRIAALAMSVVFALTQAITLKAAAAPTGEPSPALWVPVLLAVVGLPVALVFGRPKEE